MEDSTKAQFLAIGLDPKVVESTLKNKKVTQRLKEVIELSGQKETNKNIGNLLYGVATKMPETTFIHTKFLID
jgi:trehalose-6-phosphate synthase